jgi:hypothetical protein
MLSQNVICLATPLFELNKPHIILPTKNVSHVWRENKWNTLALDSIFTLEIAKEMTEIDVEKVATLICKIRIGQTKVV